MAVNERFVAEPIRNTAGKRVGWTRRPWTPADDPVAMHRALGITLEQLDVEGNPRLACDCGRVTQADMFVFYDGRFMCDGCWTLIRRTVGLERAKTDRSTYALGSQNMPREIVAVAEGRRPGPHQSVAEKVGDRIAAPPAA